MLVQIEGDFFRGVDVRAASLLKGSERRAFRLEQVERLLKERHGSTTLAVLLSDMFWTADEGRQLPEHPNPILSDEWQQEMSREEKAALRLVMETAGMCHDLALHFTPDLHEAFGIRGAFWVSNRALREWLSTTRYELTAMHAAYALKKRAIDAYAYRFYQPAQDELAELFSLEHQQPVGRPERTEIPARDYVRLTLDALLAIERHWQRGRRLKLRPDVMMLHDEIYGLVPRRFDARVLKAAQTLYDYLDAHVYGRLTQERADYDEVLGGFAEKVRQVRRECLPDGWVEDDSLEFNYLMAHAERCGNGFWREEDDAL